VKDSILSDGSYGTFEGSIDDDVVHGHYRREGTWAPELHALLVDGLFPTGKGTFLDVGANIGLVCIPLVERRGVRCLAFEPEPRNHRWLERNIARHGLESLFQTFDVALHSDDQMLRFELSANNYGDHRLSGEVDPEDDCSRESILVAGKRLDDLVRLEELPRPIVAKVDTQGAEVRVLSGASRSLPLIDQLICEYWPYGLHRMGDSAETLNEILQGFPFGAVLSKEDLPRRLTSTRELLQGLSWIPTDGSDRGFYDLLLSRSEQLPGLA
jgi:FkbM family methyltransferase